MAFTLNSVDLSTYGIYAGQAPGGNIALQGCFDLPKRIGDTHYIWAEDHSVQPFVAADEIFFGGRDLILYGTIFGTNSVINNYLETFYTAVKAFSGLVTLSTPYGDFSVQVKDIKTNYISGACSVIINFREPVVTLTGGTLPTAGASNYTIDGIPFSSFGLYLSKAESLHDLPGLKDQNFTKYGSEGYQISKYKNNTLDINGFIIATSLSDFQSKIKALYLCFKSLGLRVINLNYEKTAVCFATEGFSISNVYVLANSVIGSFKISLLCQSISNTGVNWFLPSKDELKEMYDELYLYSVGGFTADNYWCSSEISSGAAGKYNFSSGAYGPGAKESPLYVRACRSFTALAGAYSLRDSGPGGGLIFIVSGTTYYEAAPWDQSAGYVWSNITDAAIGTTSTDIGKGHNNTDEIIAQAGHTDSAAKLCSNLKL